MTLDSEREQIAINRRGSAAVLDALAMAAGPGGVVAVNEDGAVAVHQSTSEIGVLTLELSCDHHRRVPAAPLDITGALRALVVAIGDGSVVNMSSRTALAYQHAVATLRRYDGADYHADDAQRIADAFGGRAGR